MISGADPAGSGSSRGGSGGIHYSPSHFNADKESYSGGGGGGGGVMGFSDDGARGISPSVPGGLFGMGGRREHAGAWLLCDAVKSLLGALVAVPGHPDLGPFYLLRGLLKAVRRRVFVRILYCCAKIINPTCLFLISRMNVGQTTRSQLFFIRATAL